MNAVSGMVWKKAVVALLKVLATPVVALRPPGQGFELHHCIAAVSPCSVVERNP
jgi:hypothetical protein